ncbi:MAG TPA: response regulator [Afipia sp.]
MDRTLPGGPPVANSADLPEHVLIVEDDPLIAFLAEETVRELGVKSVRTAASVTRALESIRAHAPDFALLDVGLIRENSFAVAEELERLKIPFIFVTGYAADSIFPVRFASRPMLSKPYTRDELLVVLGKWRNAIPQE